MVAHRFEFNEAPVVVFPIVHGATTQCWGSDRCRRASQYAIRSRCPLGVFNGSRLGRLAVTGSFSSAAVAADRPVGHLREGFGKPLRSGWWYVHGKNKWRIRAACNDLVLPSLEQNIV